MGTIYRAQGLLSEPSGVRRDRFTRVTSDLFSGAGAAVGGRLTDIGAGGSPYEWGNVGAGVTAGGGTLSRAGGSGTWGAALNIPVADLRVAMTIDALPSNGFMVDIRRKSLSGTPDGFRCNVSADGSVSLLKRVGGASTTLDSAPAAAAAGARLVVQVRGARLEALVDGILVCETTDSTVAGAGWAGLAGSGATTFTVSGLIIDAID